MITQEELSEFIQYLQRMRQLISEYLFYRTHLANMKVKSEKRVITISWVMKIQQQNKKFTSSQPKLSFFSEREFYFRTAHFVNELATLSTNAYIEHDNINKTQIFNQRASLKKIFTPNIAFYHPRRAES